MDDWLILLLLYIGSMVALVVYGLNVKQRDPTLAEIMGEMAENFRVLRETIIKEFTPAIERLIEGVDALLKAFSR